MKYEEFAARQRGIGIIELLVGMLIAMVGIVAIFQVLNVSRGFKDTTTSGVEAQVGASIALYRLERELKHAGFGVGRLSPALLGCTVKAVDTGRTPSTFEFNLLPIRLVPGLAVGDPVQIDLLAGSSPILTESVRFTGSTDTAKTMSARAGFFPNDFVIAARTSPTTGCALHRITTTPAASPLLVEHSGGAFNASPAPVAFTGDGELVNLGPTPVHSRWRVSNGRLLNINLLEAGAVESEIADGVIDLQAQYGVDSNNNGVIDNGEWVTPSAATAAWTATDWGRVLAVRVGLLVRSGAREREIVTTTAPNWAGGAFTIKRDMDESTIENEEWGNYRYRSYESAVSFRNMLWGKSP